MTEDEAKTKWCPFAIASGKRFAINRAPEGEINNSCKCLGTACMAWRWDYDEYGDASEGFCGLAGRP